jgi:plasminogen activator
MRKLIAPALALLLLLAPLSATAMQTFDLTPVGSQDRFTFEASTGLLTIAANELVAQNPGMPTKYLSKLEWRADDAVLGGLEASWRPAPWLRLGLGAWKDLSGGNVNMDDYDWYAPTTEWSNWSGSTDVRTLNILLVDANSAARLFANKTIELSVLGGIRRDAWKWQAWGGQYIYPGDGWRDRTGDLPPGPGITYEQIFWAPYLGLALKATHGPVTAALNVRGTMWAWCEAEDTHHHRNLHFIDRMQNIKHLSLGLGLAYRPPASGWFGSLRAAYEVYDMNGWGDETVSDLTPGGTPSHEAINVAGAEARALMLSLSVGYAF